MKHAYRRMRPLLAALFSLIALTANAQQPWRPFRPGLIYSYDLRLGTNTTHTLRVDSVYQALNGDSVYAFNRLMRKYGVNTGLSVFAKSRNNLFGARVKWTPGQGYYTFESDAQNNVQSASSLRIYPRVATGQTWVASTAPTQTALMRSRVLRTVLPGVQDSVATIEIYAGTATTGVPTSTLVLSRSYGLLEGTPWLGGAVAGTQATAPLLAMLPVPLMQSAYSPLNLFTMQPGDELGYYYEPFNYFGSIVCFNAHTLRQIISRQQRADSLVFTYREQGINQNFGWSVCGNTTPSTLVSQVKIGRLAFSMTTGRSPQYPALQLLSGEYARDAFPIRQPETMGLGLINPTSGNSCLSSGGQLCYQRVYINNNGGADVTYSPGLDLLGWMQIFGPTPGLGDVSTGETRLIYYRRSIGTPLVCGSFINFTSLLPTRAAQAATIATLHPNPAAEAAMLTLAQPARPGHTLRLTDALGRTV